MTYPTSLDELTDGVPSDGQAPTTELDDPTFPHDDHHRALAVAVEAIETELGTDPSGAEATVKARVAAVETLADAATTPAEVVTAVAAEATLARNADNLTSGTVADARIASTIARDSEVAAAYQPLDADLTDIAAVADAQGDILVRGASGWERLAKSATSTHVLTAGASQPSWTAPAGGGDPTPRRTGLVGATYYEVPVTVATISNQTQAASTSQVAFWWPCYLHRAATIDGFASYCWTLEAGSSLRFGIYANSGTDLTVGSLTQDCGTVSGASTGNKTLAASQAMSAGWFWICVWVSNHTTARWNRRQTEDTWSPFGTTIASGRNILGYQASAVDYSAGLPGSPPALTAFNQADAPGINGPFPYWRFS